MPRKKISKIKAVRAKKKLTAAQMLDKKAKEKAVADTVRGIKLKGPIRSKLIADQVIVEEDYEIFLPFYDRSSFGEIHGIKKGRIELSLVEALYLMERGKLEVYRENGRKPFTLSGFVTLARKTEKSFWTRYRVYRELRTRGYVLKTALKFGADFRVYDRGVKPGEAHGKWVLFAANENTGLTWRQFSAMNRVAHSTRKKLLVGVVDDEGDVTYYEIRWKKP